MFTDYLIRRFVSNHTEVHNAEVRLAYGMLEAGLSVGVNIVLAALMFLGGLMLNSISLAANAAHTAADVVTSLAVFIGFRASRKPADKEHPHGHGRAEDIVSLVIAVLLVIVGYEFLAQSVSRFVNPVQVRGNPPVAIGLVVAATIKEWLARFSVALGSRVNSTALVADAWHHRSDAISMSLVSIGIVASSVGYVGVDSVMGIAVSLLIGYTGLRLGLGTASKLMGERPSEHMVERISQITRSIHGVRDTHKVLVHEYGAHAKVSLHIQVDPNIPVRESHEIAARVKYRILENMNAEAVVHVEPHQP